MKIKAKTIVGKEYEFDAEPTEKVYTLKQRISEKIGIHVDQIKLVYNGKPLREDGTLEEQNVKPGSLIQIASHIRGG
jgi:hypothetical protein